MRVGGRLVRAFPGVVEMLARLSESGPRVAVVTSKSRRRYEVDAERNGVLEPVDAAVCQEGPTEHKPDPRLCCWRSSGSARSRPRR